MAYGTMPDIQNPALAGGTASGRPRGELDQKIMDLLSKQGSAGLPTDVAPQQAQPAQGQAAAPMQSRSMDWRLRAAELMRRQMVNQSEGEHQPAWMRQRS